MFSTGSDAAGISLGLLGRRLPLCIHHQSTSAQLSADPFAIDGRRLGGQTAPQRVALRIDNEVVETVAGTAIEESPGIVEPGHTIGDTLTEVIVGFRVTFGDRATKPQTGRSRLSWVFFTPGDVFAVPFGSQYAGQLL